MRTQRADPTLLITFEAVVRHGQFKAAADELCLTDSAVSHRIRALEAHLGERLLNRTTRRVELTAAGARLIDEVGPAVKQMQRVLARPHAMTQSVRVSVLPSLARSWLLPALSDFYRCHPGVVLDIEATTRRADIAGGEADIAIRYTAKPGDHPYCERLMGDELLAVASPRFLQHHAHLSGERLLRRKPMFVHPRQPWGEWLRESGFYEDTGDPAAVLSDTSMLMDAAALGEGFALGRRSIAAPYLRRGTLVAPFAVSVPTDKSYFVLAGETLSRNAHMRAFVDWLHGLAQNDQADSRHNAANGQRLLLEV